MWLTRDVQVSENQNVKTGVMEEGALRLTVLKYFVNPNSKLTSIAVYFMWSVMGTWKWPDNYCHSNKYGKYRYYCSE